MSGIFKEVYRNLLEGNDAVVSRGEIKYFLNNKEKEEALKKFISALSAASIHFETGPHCLPCRDRRVSFFVDFVAAAEEGDREKLHALISMLPSESFKGCRRCTEKAREELVKLIEAMPDISLSDFTIAPSAALSMRQEVHGEVVESYTVRDATVRIIEHRGEYYYDIVTPIFTLNLRERSAISEALEIMKRKAISVSNAEPVIRSVCAERGVPYQKVASIFDTYYRKMGDIQYLIEDTNLTDIFINSQGRVVVVHYDYGEMDTTLTLTKEGLRTLAASYERLSGKPFDSSSPYSVFFWDEHNARISIAGYVANYSGVPELAIRIWPPEPWNVLELVRRGSLDLRCAALVNLLVYSGCAFIVGGDRGGGKSTFLQATLFMLPRKSRKVAILTDREIHRFFYENDFRISELRVHTGDAVSSQGIPIKDAVSFMLVFGESQLILFNEIKYREEAKPFFGTTAVAGMSSIATTMHADDPEGILHRLIYSFDLDPEAIRNIDFIIMTQVLRDVTGRRRRALTRISEILSFRKNPLHEGRILDLVRFNGESWDISLERSEYLERLREKWGMSKREMDSLYGDLIEFYEEKYREHLAGKLSSLDLVEQVEIFFKSWERS